MHERQPLLHSPVEFHGAHQTLEAELDIIHTWRKGKIYGDAIFRSEMEALLAAVNWERAQIDKDPVSMRKLLRVEIQASGHTDYAHKMAIYSAELVVDKEGGP